ncbi:MAG TPA: hypothetical protein VF178_12025 [Gemmatimonadaceae bacterium]
MPTIRLRTAFNDDVPPAPVLGRKPSRGTNWQRRRVFAPCALLALVSGTTPAMAQQAAGPLDVPAARQGSGTSWLPDSTPMYAIHRTWGAWNVMLHGMATLLYNHQGSDRGDTQLGLVDWEMIMASRPLAGGILKLNAMTSLEPATIGRRGYPLLLQTGESYRGQPLHDRQHPHDLVMELSGSYERALTPALGASLYAAISGEPALGPVAYMHRPSALNDPLSPLGHHWQDATHITFGVVTAGLFTRMWRLEASAFNGREPDENRWNIDLEGRKLDSWAARFTVNPTGRLSVAAWYGYLDSPEALHPDDAARRFGASLQSVMSAPGGGLWASTLLWSANRAHDRVQHSFLAETNVELGAWQSVFGRAEHVRKSADELVIANLPEDETFAITSIVAGYVREVVQRPGLSLGVGLRASVNFIPAELEPAYGTRAPVGTAIFVRLRPTRALPQTGHGAHVHHASAGRGGGASTRP